MMKSAERKVRVRMRVFCHLSKFSLLRCDVSSLFRHRAAHEQNQKHEQYGQRRGDPEYVEISQRQRLSIPRLFQRQQSHLLRLRWVAGVLQEKRPALAEQVVDGGIERIEMLVEPKGMKLHATLKDGLRHRSPDASAFVAQEG